MCQLQFIKRKNRHLTKRELSEFFKLMELGSINNDCAFGFFNDKVSFKSKGRFNLGSFHEDEKLLKSSFAIGHNRLATTGTKEKNYNNHPFELGDFVLVHNGVIQNHKELRIKFNITSKVRTDSYVILWLINHFFKESNLQDRVERIVEAIKKTTKAIEGLYSVFLYDKLNNDVYYFKNCLTEFSFCLFNDSLLVGTTNSKNVEHLFLNEKYVFDDSLFSEKKLINISSNRIYLINDSVFIQEIAQFKTTDSIFHDTYSYDDFDDMVSDIEEEIDEVFYQTIGYIPEFEFNETSGMIKLRYNNEIYNDLSCFITNLFKENDYVFFNVEELFGYVGVSSGLHCEKCSYPNNHTHKVGLTDKRINKMEKNI